MVSDVPSGYARTKFLGVWNVVRFNYDLFIPPILISLVSVYFSFTLATTSAKITALIIGLGAAVSVVVPLLASWWVYDYSPLYKLTWLRSLLKITTGPALNIHAGFDETSLLLRRHYPALRLDIMDFYDPVRHTERSIRRARVAQPPLAETVAVSPLSVGLQHGHYVAIFLILALHEIRNADERVVFLRQLRESMAPEGRLIVVEHTRDLANFCAYTIGFLHFLTPKYLEQGFDLAGFRLISQTRITPLIRVFALEVA